MRTLVVVGRPESPMNAGAMLASRHAWASVVDASSWPVTATSVAMPPSAVTLCATFAAPPIRWLAWSNITTGTGASGEMRVTRPAMNLSSMASPTTSTWTRPRPAVIAWARSGPSGGSIGARRRERQRNQDEEQHQELGIAEVVLEQPGRQHAGGRCQRHGGEHTLARTVGRV